MGYTEREIVIKENCKKVKWTKMNERRIVIKKERKGHCDINIQIKGQYCKQQKNIIVTCAGQLFNRLSDMIYGI